MNYPITPRKEDVINAIREYVDVRVYTAFYYSFVIAGILNRTFDELPIGTEVVFDYTPSCLHLWYRDNDTKTEHKRVYDYALSFIGREECI